MRRSVVLVRWCGAVLSCGAPALALQRPPVAKLLFVPEDICWVHRGPRSVKQFTGYRLCRRALRRMTG